MKKKGIVLLLTMIVVVSLTCINASATFYGKSKTSSDLGKSFISAWSQNETFDIYTSDNTLWDSCTMTCGYNTFLTNEDYVTKCHSLIYVHYGVINNSNGGYEETNHRDAGLNTGKADVTHTGSPARYYAFSGDVNI